MASAAAKKSDRNFYNFFGRPWPAPQKSDRNFYNFFGAYIAPKKLIPPPDTARSCPRPIYKPLQALIQ